MNPPGAGLTIAPRERQRWRDNIYFNEYYHGDNAAGLFASHQTGWTGLIADVIRRRHGAVRETVDLVGDLIGPLE